MSVVITTLFAALMGAYIGALADRFTYWFHVSRAFVWKVHCPHCFTPDYWRTYVPIVGYVFRRGSCLSCAERLPVAPLLLESIGGCAAVAVWLIYGVRGGGEQATVAFLLSAILLWGLLVVAVSDALYDEIPLVPYIIAAITAGALAFYLSGQSGLFESVGAGAVGGLVMIILYALSRGRWVHSHDVLIGVLLSLIMGWPYFLVTLAFAYLFGIIGGLLTWGYNVKQIKGASSYGMYLFVAAALQGVLLAVTELMRLYGSP